MGSTFGFIVKTTAVKYRLGPAGSQFDIPDVKYVQWAFYRTMQFPEAGSTDPPTSADGRAWGTLLTHDTQVAQTLFDLTPRGMDPVLNYGIFPQLLVYYVGADRVSRFKVFKTVIFCTYPGASIFTIVGKDTGFPQIQTIPFRVCMPADGDLNQYVYDGTVT